jgi:hypothetical protein
LIRNALRTILLWIGDVLKFQFFNPNGTADFGRIVDGRQCLKRMATAAKISSKDGNDRALSFLRAARCGIAL